MSGNDSSVLQFSCINLCFRPVVYQWITEKKRRPREQFNFQKTKKAEYLFCFYAEAQSRKRRVKVKQQGFEDEIKDDFE